MNYLRSTSLGQYFIDEKGNLFVNWESQLGRQLYTILEVSEAGHPFLALTLFLAAARWRLPEEHQEGPHAVGRHQLRG